MSELRSLIRAELAKIRTTRTVYLLLAGATSLVVLGVAAAISTTSLSKLDLASDVGVRTVLHAAGAGPSIFCLALGVVLSAGEFRHGTITETLLTTPRRGRVVAAKLIAGTSTGLLFGLVGAVVGLTVAIPWLDAKDVPLPLSDPNVWLSLAGGVAWNALYGAIGVSVGSLVRNPIGAIVGSFAWLLVAEQLAVNVFRSVGKWLPGASAMALGRAEEGLLPMWGGGLMLTAYAIGFALLAARLTMRRDVT